MVDKQVDLNWMNEVRAAPNVSTMKGMVVNIEQPKEIKTQFGMRQFIEIQIKNPEMSVIANEWLGTVFPTVPPNSNLGKLLSRYKCRTLKDLIGQEVEAELIKGRFWKIVR